MSDSIHLLQVMETLENGWSKVKGSKSPIWGALLLVLVISIGLGVFNGLVSTYSKTLSSLTGFITQIFTTLLDLGIAYIGIKRAQDFPIVYGLVFRAFESKWLWLKIVFLYVIECLIFIVPMIFIFAGIFLISLAHSALAYVLGILICIAAAFSIVYLAVRLALSVAFILDKEVNPSDAIALSFQATRSNFWRLTGISILQVLILIISAIPLGIGLIWTIPFVLIVYGLIYKNLSVNASIGRVD